jgi:hypothetical protein
VSGTLHHTPRAANRTTAPDFVDRRLRLAHPVRFGVDSINYTSVIKAQPKVGAVAV